MLKSKQNLKITYVMNKETEGLRSLVLSSRSFSLDLHQSQGRESTFIVCHIRDRHFLALSKLIFIKKSAGGRGWGDTIIPVCFMSGKPEAQSSDVICLVHMASKTWVAASFCS